MLCAILIPSRGRPDRLLRTLESIWASVSSLMNVEILVRLDDDDHASLSQVEDLRFRGVRVLVGSRYEGYRSLNRMYHELAELTAADWLCVMNDDAVIVGNGWDDLLAEVPTTGFIVQPELYQLGFSKYYNTEGAAFPIFPNNSWKPEWDGFLDPIDVKIDELLRGQKGWKTHFLPGIGVAHDRDDDTALEEHRRLA